jgi:Protein of unknown function (DUF3050)
MPHSRREESRACCALRKQRYRLAPSRFSLSTRSPHPCDATFHISPASTDFVHDTLNCAIRGSVVEVAAYFFFGREDIIPDMFERPLKLWDHGAVEVPYFNYYLKRHIELDGDSHGPWAREMLITLAGQDESSWKQATSAAELAITSRIKLWDSVQTHLNKAPTVQH